MGFFNWAAPVFGHFADRWSPKQISEIADWLRPFLSAVPECPPKILDVGGGTGALATRLQVALAADVTVLDPTPQMLSYLDPDGPVKQVQGVAESIPFGASEFDVVIVTDAFHHFRDQPGAVSEFARVVKPGGGVVIVELDPRGWLMRMVVVAERLLGEPGAFFAPGEMCDFMAERGIKGHCSEIRGVSYRFVGTVVK